MQDKIQEIEFFNKFSTQPYEVFKEETYKKILDIFADYVEPKDNQQIVEFGCATGSFTKRIMERFPNVKMLALDISPNCIDYAKKMVKIKNLEFEVADVENTKLVDEFCNIVVGFAILHHFPDFSNAVKEAYRILKPCGKYFGIEPNKKNPIMWLYRDKKSPFYSSKGVTLQEKPLCKKEIENVFKRIGFENIKIFGVSGVYYKYIESNFFKQFLWIYNLYESIFNKLRISKEYGAFLIVYAEK